MLNYHQIVNNRLLPLLIFMLMIGASISCKKEIGFIEGNSIKLNFSTDTVIFDTVFTTVGSATKQFKIYNPYSKKLLVSHIWLAGGNNSQFKLNIDGVPGPSAKDVEIAPNDSLFIFAEVTVNPLNSNSPLVVSDSVLFEINGNTQHVELVAWGQDAHYIRPNLYLNGYPPLNIVAQENQNITWCDDKPWVVYGYAVVDSAATLNICPGTKIHFHKNSGMLVYRYGKLNVNGNKALPVTFQGDRLDYDYREIAGQWDRILIQEGAKSTINYAIIKNAFIGIQAETNRGRDNMDDTQLILNNTKISNMDGFGLYGIYFNIRATNLVITNVKQYALATTGGGNYSFRHCTVGNFYTGGQQRQTASITINNYTSSEQVIGLDSCYFGNCILYGNIANEFSIDSLAGANCKFKFENCILKIDPAANTSNTSQFINTIKNPSDVLIDGINQQPLFKNPSLLDYSLRQTAPAVNAGLPLIGQQVPLDIDEFMRDNTPDIGAFEYH